MIHYAELLQTIKNNQNRGSDTAHHVGYRFDILVCVYTQTKGADLIEITFVVFRFPITAPISWIHGSLFLHWIMDNPADCRVM